MWLPWRRVLLGLFILLTATLLVALTGPFGTFGEDGLASRFVYWGVTNSSALVIALAFRYALRDLLSGREYWVGQGFVILGTSLVFTPLLFVWTVYWFPSLQTDPPDLVWMGLNVLMITTLVSALHNVARKTIGTSEPAPPTPRPPALLDRLPEDVRAPILRLEGEGHYVLIVTERGTARVRLRLSDAVREMGSVPGHWTHRSHWVAELAIHGPVAGASKPVLALSNGDQVPISRTYRPALAEAGLL
ncbi:MAG: LytTR family DNA-binding domain-containing protein [Pseudomonadota bacterium]